MRKLIIGNKTVGGLPKEEPSKAQRKITEEFKRLRLTLEEEDLTVKVYGRFIGDEDEERVLGTATISTRIDRTSEKTQWIKSEGPTEIHLIAARDLIVTRVTCTLPLSLRDLRPVDYEQDMPVAPTRIRANDSVTVPIPTSLISLR